MSFGGGPSVQQSAYQPLPTVTPAPPPPSRSDTQVQQLADEQRRKYGIGGGRSQTMQTGGMGVAPSSTYNAVTALLGGGS